MSRVSTPVPRLRAAPLAAALAAVLSATALASTPPTSAATTPTAARYALRQQVRHAPRAPKRAAPAPRGATRPVTSCGDDDDPGTLRNVLAVAAEGDVVDLSALTCSTITLTQGAIDVSVLGEHHLYDVTIQGPGRDALTIDAAGASQVLVVGGFSSGKGTVTLNDVTVANGAYAGSLAACIEGFGGAVALNRVAVTNCHATGHYELLFGGAVDVNTLEMTDSSITDSDVVGTGARSNAAGGGAYVGEDAILVRSTVSGNSARAPYASYDGYASVGGGLYVRHDLTLVDSTISGNSIEATEGGQYARGGGVYVRGFATIARSTISGNRTDGDGGGVFKAIYSVFGEPGGSNPTTVMTIANSTISGNTAALGGGIVSSRPLDLANSTVADNEAPGGGAGVLFRLAGIKDSDGTLHLRSSIVATNLSSDDATFATDLDADGTLAIDGANDLMQFVGAAVTLPADTITADPLLLPLADNGGPTRTQALAAGSPAIDAGNDAAELDTDQRGDGFPRVVGAAADIGAFEVQGPPDTIFVDGFDGAAPP